MSSFFACVYTQYSVESESLAYHSNECRQKGAERKCEEQTVAAKLVFDSRVLERSPHVRSSKTLKNQVILFMRGYIAKSGRNVRHFSLLCHFHLTHLFIQNRKFYFISSGYDLALKLLLPREC